MKTTHDHPCFRPATSWRTALMCLAILLTVRFFHIPPSIWGDEWEQARLAVMERHQDPGVARFCRQADALKAKSQLTETVKIITERYYQQVSLKTLLEKALRQLQSAVETPLVAEQFQVPLTQLSSLKTVIESQRRQLEQKSDCSTDDLYSLLAALIPDSQQAGLGSAWPSLELSYALTSSLDDYSYVLTPDQYQSLQDRLGGLYVGIGVDLIFEGPYPTLFDVVEDSPAAKAGIRPGDLLIAVNEFDCRGQQSGTVSALLTGQTRSAVQLTIRREQQDLILKANRDIIVAPSVRSARLLRAHDRLVGYLRIASFDNDTAMEMRRQMDLLIQQGAQGLMIDLRSNGGGIMTSAIDAVRLFIPEGTIVTVCSNDDRIRYCAGGASGCYTLPLAILVDKNTASAAEIFAAALKDHHRATIIGHKTFGKALVQTVYGLQTGATALCLTTACYLPPSSANLQQVGIQPDITVQYSDENIPPAPSVSQFLSPDDPTLHQAMKLLTTGPAS